MLTAPLSARQGLTAGSAFSKRSGHVREPSAPHRTGPAVSP